MTCPNSDKNFDKTLSNFVDITNDNYPNTRKHIFYGICIPIRLILYTLVFMYRDMPIIQYIIAIASLIAVINLSNTMLFSKTKLEQWWSKQFQLLIAILLLVSSILIISGYNISTMVIPIILFASLFGGVLQSMMITFC
jgi:hypothetical protein